ncbi:unnamed protein product, partial [Phaeothamnion confervicola]
TALVLQFCYIDAGNFNAAKEHLLLEGVAEPGAAALLRAFRSPLFDTAMERRPAVLGLDQFRTWPR